MGTSEVGLFYNQSMKTADLVVIAVTLIACGGSPPAPDDMAALDLAPSGIVLPATDGTVSLAGSDISLAGAGTTRVGNIALTKGAGTVTLDGRSVPVAVYEKQDWSSQGYFLYQGLAVEPSRIWVVWFYCTTTGGALSDVYFESTDGTAVTREAASGTCQDTGVSTAVPVHFPAIDLPLPSLVAGYTISGAAISLDGAMPGQVTLGGTSLELLVFDTVDCTLTCGTPGWTELHALLWDRAGQRACFAILYLMSNDTTHVRIAYSLTLPVLTEPAGNLLLPATWTAM
jgi:hypothetical protein